MSAPFPARFPLTPIFEHPIAEHELKQFTQSVGGRLPEDFVRFLQQYNGVRFTEFPPRFQLRDEPDEDERQIVWCLYGLSEPSRPNDLRQASKGYDFVWRVPSSVVAIGDDGSWNRICLSLAADSVGQVLFWNPGEAWEYAIQHEGQHIPLTGDQNERTTKYLNVVANSFTDFWQTLEANPEYWEG